MSMLQLDLNGYSSEAVTVCVSGGVDSCVMLSLLSEHFNRVYPVFVRNGYAWEDTEFTHLQRYLQAVNISNIEPVAEISTPISPMMDKVWGDKGYYPAYTAGYSSNYIPGRNMVLLNSAVISAFSIKSQIIALGVLAGNPYPDAQKEFFTAFEEMVWQAMRYRVKIITPLIELEKHQVMSFGRTLPLELSFSCVLPQEGLHCGSLCNKCAERQKGFYLAGIKDLTPYANKPPEIDWCNHEFSYD